MIKVRNIITQAKNYLLFSTYNYTDLIKILTFCDLQNRAVVPAVLS
jgi:hypothetical protein